MYTHFNLQFNHITIQLFITISSALLFYRAGNCNDLILLFIDTDYIHAVHTINGVLQCIVLPTCFLLSMCESYMTISNKGNILEIATSWYSLWALVYDLEVIFVLNQPSVVLVLCCFVHVHDANNINFRFIVGAGKA